MGESPSGSLCSASSCIWAVFLSLGDLNEVRGSQKEKTLLWSLLESVRAQSVQGAETDPPGEELLFRLPTHARLEAQRHLFNSH